MSKENHIVLTTINYPLLLKEYYNNFEKHQELDSVKLWVVGDEKTPSTVKRLCRELTDSGLESVYLDITVQEKWGRQFPDFYRRIPYNNETRRNIGYLNALEDGCMRIISIDDDNWPTPDNFIKGHSLTGKEWDKQLLSDPSGFYNVCEHLEFEPSRHVFPRGYPFALRNKLSNPRSRSLQQPVDIGVTMGLWLGEPDIDATTWLNGKVTGISYSGQDLFVLDQNTWSPINTQNTSVVRELVPAFFCVPMGWDVPGGKIQRYGDIWGGYFLQALIQGTEFNVAFGKPLVDHRRNPHNYLVDLRQEFWGMILTDWLLDILREDFYPKEDNICDRVAELSEFLVGTAIAKLPSWCAPEMKSFIAYTGETLLIWAEVCKDILSYSQRTKRSGPSVPSI